MKTKNDKSRRVLVHIEADELERIVRDELGGITIEAVITHSNVKITAKTGEDEDVELYHIK